MTVTFLTDVSKYNKQKLMSWITGSVNTGSDDPNNQGLVNTYRPKYNTSRQYLRIEDDCIITKDDAEIKLYFYSTNSGAAGQLIGNSGDEYLSGIIKVKDYMPDQAKYYKVVVHDKNNIDINITDDDEKLYAHHNVAILTNPNILSNFNYEQYNIPKVYVYGDLGKPNSKDENIKCTYKYINGTTVKEGTCKMKWQGSSSISYPKKNYTVKFYTDDTYETEDSFEVVSGWGEHNKYVFKADWIDFSHSRNLTCAKSWTEIVKTRKDLSTEGTIGNRLSKSPRYGAVDGFPIFLIINGDWHGVYNWNIPKEDWTFGMNTEDSVDKKEVVISASGKGNGLSNFTTDLDLSLGTNAGFEVEYATDEDDTTNIQNSFNKMMNVVRNSDGTDIDTTVAKYLDIQSAIDYYVFAVLISHYDGIIKNALFCSYDYQLDENEELSTNGKWFLSAYDMDGVLGLTYHGRETDAGDAYRNFTSYDFDQVASNYSHKLFKLLWTHKKEQILARYQELIKDKMSVSVVADRFRTHISKIPQSAHIVDGELWQTIPNTMNNNTEQVNDWYKNRVEYLNNKYFGDPLVELSEKIDDIEEQLQSGGIIVGETKGMKPIRTFIVGDESTYKEYDILVYLDDEGTQIQSVGLVTDNNNEPFHLKKIWIKVTHAKRTDITTNYNVTANPYSNILYWYKDQNNPNYIPTGFGVVLKLNNGSASIVPGSTYYQHIYSFYNENMTHYAGFNNIAGASDDSATTWKVWNKSFSLLPNDNFGKAAPAVGCNSARIYTWNSDGTTSTTPLAPGTKIEIFGEEL